MQRAVAQDQSLGESTSDGNNGVKTEDNESATTTTAAGTAEPNTHSNAKSNVDTDGQKEPKQQHVSDPPTSTFPQWITDWALTLRG